MVPEFSWVFVFILTEIKILISHNVFSRREVNARVLMGDLADRRIQLYVNSAMKSYERRDCASDTEYSDMDNEDDTDDDVDTSHEHQVRKSLIKSEIRLKFPSRICSGNRIFNVLWW